MLAVGRFRAIGSGDEVPPGPGPPQELVLETSRSSPAPHRLGTGYPAV
jgi:hypothetical protein